MGGVEVNVACTWRCALVRVGRCSGVSDKAVGPADDGPDGRLAGSEGRSVNDAVRGWRAEVGRAVTRDSVLDEGESACWRVDLKPEATGERRAG